MQSRRQSLVETITNTSVGFVGSWLIMLACLNLIEDKVLVATVTTILCTVWSLVRGYTLRRYFTKKHERQADHHRTEGRA